MDSRERDEFARIKVYQDIEKARYIVGKYEESLAFYRREIEDYMVTVGRLKERLGEK